MAAMPAPAPAQTLGESLAHVPRHKIWTCAVFLQIVWPALITSCLYACIPPQQGFGSFFRGAPWRLPLALSWGLYWSLLHLIMSYAQLFLPRTPVAVAEKVVNVGAYGVGVGMTAMVGGVLGCGVKGGRALAGCTAVVDVIVVGLVAFWVWIARTYGGDGEESAAPPAALALEGRQH